MESETKFICDMMLGRLSKWLKILGYDTLYFREITDAKLLRYARDENRLLLTRDTRLMERRPIRVGQVQAILIADDNWRAQLSQVAGELNLVAQPVPRCAKCNARLRPVGRESVKNHVPPYVWKSQRSFTRCPKCAQIFWQATHWDNIKATASELVTSV
ncbi:MAG TPA: hypothetical protein ENI11_03460 [Actinobacteria bacterium]|nr:hypothetical protein [Actinomycetota bacterium]